jgi:hypothetical protein
MKHTFMEKEKTKIHLAGVTEKNSIVDLPVWAKFVQQGRLLKLIIKVLHPNPNIM